MRRLHNLWILHDIGVDVVNAIQVIATLGGERRIEAAGKVSQAIESDWIEDGIYLASRACSNIQFAPVTMILRFLPSTALPLTMGKLGAPVW